MTGLDCIGRHPAECWADEPRGYSLPRSQGRIGGMRRGSGRRPVRSRAHSCGWVGAGGGARDREAVGGASAVDATAPSGGQRRPPPRGSGGGRDTTGANCDDARPPHTHVTDRQSRGAPPLSHGPSECPGAHRALLGPCQAPISCAACRADTGTPTAGGRVRAAPHGRCTGGLRCTAAPTAPPSATPHATSAPIPPPPHRRRLEALWNVWPLWTVWGQTRARFHNSAPLGVGVRGGGGPTPPTPPPPPGSSGLRGGPPGLWPIKKFLWRIWRQFV